MNFFITFILIVASLSGYIFVNNRIDQINDQVMVTSKKSIDDYFVYTVSYQQKYYHMTSNQTFVLGSIITLKATVEYYESPSIPGGFDEKTYHLGQNTYGRLRSINIVEINHDAFSTILFKLIDWNHPLILLIKDQMIIDTSIYSFLFTLSSIHLALIVWMLRKFMYYLDIKNQQKTLWIFTILLMAFMIGGSVLILRYALYHVFLFLSKKYKWTISRLDSECLITIIIIIFMPHIVYNQTFILITLFIFFNQLAVIRNSISQAILIPLILIPFMLSWNHELDILAFFIIPILMKVAKYILVPSIIIIIIFPLITIMTDLENIINELLIIFEFKHDQIFLPTLPWYGIIIYLCFIVWLYSATNQTTFYRRLLVLGLCFIIAHMSTLLPRSDEVIFLDVGQGDSAVIFKNQMTIVVDAFGDVESFLKYRYIQKIDYLILTHNDQDHMKNAKVLLNEFDVKYLVLSGYLDYQLEHHNIINITSDNLESIDEVELTFLAPYQSYQSPNDCSVVFKINVNHQSYLFTGDISSRVEEDLINRYGKRLDVDILKVAHHGSETSSSLEWLQITTPTYAVVSVGKFNIYGFPNQSIMNRYHSLGIYLYLTSENGTIIFTERKVIMFS